MKKELTSVEIEQIREEIAHRQTVVTPECIAEVQRTRALGDLSENDEYRSAKRELNRNYSRIRYLKAMLEGAVEVNYTSEDGKIGMFDTVTFFDCDMEEERKITLVTALRADVLRDMISKESPLGAALLGHKVGDKVEIRVNDDYTYEIEILDIEKGKDDSTMKISSY